MLSTERTDAVDAPCWDAPEGTQCCRLPRLDSHRRAKCTCPACLMVPAAALERGAHACEGLLTRLGLTLNGVRMVIIRF